MSLVDALPLALVGFSFVIGLTLLFAYLRSNLFPKSVYSVSSVLLLTVCLGVLQGHHAAYFLSEYSPTSSQFYVYTLGLAPAAFFMFGRFVLSPDSGFSPYLVLCLLPLSLPIAVPVRVAINIVLLIGAGYALWFAWIVISLRALRKQYVFEMGFALVVTLMASLMFLFSTFLRSDGLFYWFYSQSIGVAYMLVTFALVAIPDFVEDLFESARAKYSLSTLVGIDEAGKFAELDDLMQTKEPWRDERLNLSGLAREVALSGHQLSELLNQRRGVSFSTYVRGYRIQAAKSLLVAEPSSSVLAISLEVGFRSQSTFYAAFKAETGVSPGDYRKRHGTP